MLVDNFVSKPSHVALSVLASWIVYLLAGAIYRLYFSPIAKFPGRKLAALTLWYEFYYDVIKRGQYTFEIRKMHEEYGPIVRTNPYELHIDDPDYYDELYSGPSKRRDKWEWSARMFGNALSMLGTVPHEHHRIRRGALSPYFSKRSVTNLEPMIQSNIDILCRRFREFQRAKKPVNLYYAFAALTMDIITEYSFARSYGMLETPEFDPLWANVIMDLSQASHLNKQFAWLLPLLKSLPDWFVAWSNPNMRQLIKFQKDLEKQIRAIMDGDNRDYKTATHPTIFHELLSSSLSADEKSLQRLVEEGQTVVGAGQITTTHFLRTTSYHILANRQILQKLKQELSSAIPNPDKYLSVQELEQLPFLSAVVLEGYRISYGVASRLQRVSPDLPLTFHEWVIPAGTPVGMTSIFMHENPKIFPEPREFKPERWFKKSSAERLEKYLVNFSRGTRQCLGINLAHAEIYLTLAAIFRQFDMELYDTIRERDVDMAYDFFNPCPSLDSPGVRVLIN